MSEQSASDFIGQGISWPLRVDQRGGIAISSGTEDIDRSIRMVLSTAPGERLMRPDFGCRIWEQLFEPVNPGTMGLMEEAVREAVQRWEPRADLEQVIVEPNPDDPGRVDIEVVYQVRTTNDRRNLVYPFYVIPQEGEP